SAGHCPRRDRPSRGDPAACGARWDPDRSVNRPALASSRRMIQSPLSADPVFHLGPVPVTGPVVTTWGLIAVLSIVAMLATRRLALRPTRVQAIVELLVTTIADQIRETMRAEPARFLPLIGTLLIFLSAANLISLLPGL